MKNRITELFAGKKKDILSVFFTAGFPGLEDTGRILQLLEQAGVDMVEIGIPFSDPVADGPVIQESNKIALDNGMTVRKLLQQLKDARPGVKLPILLMGYVNPVLQYGVDAFCKDASAAGADGVILPDLPMDEYLTEYEASFRSNGLLNTFLISPTTSDERIRKIDSVTNGFIYAVSASSTTGAKKDFGEDQVAYFRKLQSLKLKNPFLVGFGISNHATFAQACQYGAGAIIGSAFINVLKTSTNLPSDIPAFVKSIRYPEVVST